MTHLEKLLKAENLLHYVVHDNMLVITETSNILRNIKDWLDANGFRDDSVDIDEVSNFTLKELWVYEDGDNKGYLPIRRCWSKPIMANEAQTIAKLLKIKLKGKFFAINEQCTKLFQFSTEDAQRKFLLTH